MFVHYCRVAMGRTRLIALSLVMVFAAMSACSGCKTRDVNYAVTYETREPRFWWPIGEELFELFPVTLIVYPVLLLSGGCYGHLFENDGELLVHHPNWRDESTALRIWGMLTGITQLNAAIDLVYDVTVWPIEWAVLHHRWEERSTRASKDRDQRDMAPASTMSEPRGP